MLNSIYGAFGNKWFHFFNINIAESITLQGQNAILYSENILNKYLPTFEEAPKSIDLKLPKLKKVNGKSEPTKMELPKLKKV